MSYVKFEHRHFGDSRWLDLSPAAFTVHAWALRHCNEQATDGEIPRKVALRLVCPVMPAELEAAWSELCEAGFWGETAEGFVCPEFLAHGIAAAEQDATRQKWAEDKRRQRLHNIGNHQLCSANRCPAAAMSTSGQVEASTAGQVDDPTRPDPTRPDPFGGRGEGGGRRPAHGSAAPTRETRGSQAPPPPPEDAEERLGIKHHERGPDCCAVSHHPNHPIHRVGEAVA